MRRSIMMYGLILSVVGTCHAQISLAGDTTITFATADEGRKILTTRDDFVRALSPFDRAVRVKTAGPVSEKAFLEFVGRNVLDWTEAEKASLTSTLERLQTPFDRLALPWRKAICFIKTTGKEEGGAAYTRDHALILPQNMVTPNRAPSPRLLGHELFHILSRSHPGLRDRLYQAIGFVKCNEIELPETLRNRKITNPDAPANDHCIRVQVAGADVWAVPIIFSRTERYDVEQGRDFFSYMQSQLLLIDRADNSPNAKPRYAGSQPRLVDFSGVRGFYEQVGRNTEYIIHPEEILADNFAMLVMGDQNVPSPEILKTLQDVLTEKAGEERR
ncbi:MAG: hypothetical protein M1376_10725 [Planctomycetes bacterium]|nr:hypothetical protein [Planctomycetota bacterium]